MPTHPTLRSALDAPSIRDQIADHGRERVELLLRMALAETLDMMTLVTPPNANWTDVFVQDFIDRHGHDTLDDFALFLQMFRRSELHEPGKPQLYGGRVDGMVMFECWERYLGKKCDVREHDAVREKDIKGKELIGAMAEDYRFVELSKHVKGLREQSKLEQQRELQLRREQHRLEGLREAEGGRSVAEFALVLMDFPYQSVRSAVERRCRELALPFEEVLNYKITYE